MPRLRSSKRIKASSTTYKPSTAATKQVSLTANKRNDQGARPARFATLPPLHMTTRRAAKTASNHSHSNASSVAGTGSRRSSLNDLALPGDARSDVEDERPAKRARLTTESRSPQHSAGVSDTQPVLKAKMMPQPTSTSRSTSNDSKPASRKRRASIDSMVVRKSVPARPGVLTRTASEISEPRILRKKRRTATQPQAEVADQPPELTDASTAPNSPENITDYYGGQTLRHMLPTNGDAPTKLGRRMPGRRRAPHSNVDVETDLRRQLNLKMSYRSLAKIQKQILEELASRTLNELENDPDYHKQAPEYAPLMAALDWHKASRLAQLTSLRSEKLAQLERVRIATEYIEGQKFLHRFQDLQEDLLLQCYYRLKQLQRGVKSNDGKTTDDEDNVITATHVEFPSLNEDDRLGSQYASRSRAYVEIERLIADETLQRRFDQMRRAFVLATEDADDTIANQAGDFAAFAGPDRADAMVHWNFSNLLDAAQAVDSKPQLQVPGTEVAPNEAADALLLLATISETAPRNPPQKIPMTQLLKPIALQQEISPARLPSLTETMASEVGDSHLDTISRNYRRSISMGFQEANKILLGHAQDPRGTPVRSTHRVMDMLNNDTEALAPRTHEPQSPIAERGLTALSRKIAHVHRPTPSHGSHHELDVPLRGQGPPSDHRSFDSLHAPPPPSEALPLVAPSNPYRPSLPPFSYPKETRGKESDEALRKMDPLNAIRAMLDRKAFAGGKKPSRQRKSHADQKRKASSDQRRASAIGAPPTQTLSPHSQANQPSTLGKDARRSSITLKHESAGPQPSYMQSPSGPPPFLHHAQPPPEPTSPREEQAKCSKGKHKAQLSNSSNYTQSPPPPYPTELGQTDTSRPQLPSINTSLPSKSAASALQGPVNYRFAHYEPNPRGTTYGPPPSNYYTSQSSTPYSTPPAQHRQTTTYLSSASSVSYHGYVPPPGSFQAPPPPPGPSASRPPVTSQYPTLKILQYGGQPILPATLAPTPPSQPSLSLPGQMSTSTNYSTQPSPMSPRKVSQDRSSAAPSDAGPAPEGSAEPQPKQRRQYRAYHPHGTMFRPYQGPESSGRRRGG